MGPLPPCDVRTPGQVRSVPSLGRLRYRIVTMLFIAGRVVRACTVRAASGGTGPFQQPYDPAGVLTTPLDAGQKTLRSFLRSTSWTG